MMVKTTRQGKITRLRKEEITRIALQINSINSSSNNTFKAMKFQVRVKMKIPKNKDIIHKIMVNQIIHI